MANLTLQERIRQRAGITSDAAPQIDTGLSLQERIRARMKGDVNETSPITTPQQQPIQVVPKQQQLTSKKKTTDWEQIRKDSEYTCPVCGDKNA